MFSQTRETCTSSVSAQTLYSMFRLFDCQVEWTKDFLLGVKIGV